MRPLLVVPGLFSTELYDDDRACLWGKFRSLYGGPPIATLGRPLGRPGRIMRKIPIVGGLAYDLLGALERALGTAGYHADKTLAFFAYDWRLRVVDLGATLAREVRRFAAQVGGPIDLLGLSNGGLVIRAAFAEDRSLPVERVVTSGAPNAGTIETLACMDRGFQFAPLGRTVSPEQFMACPGALDSLPAPGWAAFSPADGRQDVSDCDLYDVGTWRRLRLSVFRNDPDDPVWVDVLERRLSAARESWRVLEGAAAPRRLVCICGDGLPTQTRIVVRNGRADVPGEGRLGDLPADAVGRGDGAMTVAAARAWTAADPEVVPIKVKRHRDTVRTKAAFDAILAALH